MLVIGAGIHLELAEHGAAQRILGQHALHGSLDDTRRMRLAKLAERTNAPQVAAIFRCFLNMAVDEEAILKPKSGGCY